MNERDTLIWIQGYLDGVDYFTEVHKRKIMDRINDSLSPAKDSPSVYTRGRDGSSITTKFACQNEEGS